MKFMSITNYLKKYGLYFISLIFFSCTLFFVSCSQQEQGSDPVLHRLVMFKYKAEVSQAELEEVKQTFYGLKEKLPGMLEVVWARDLNYDLNNQFTYALMLSFSSEHAMKEYEEHPDHQALLQRGPEMIDTFFAMTYWTREEGMGSHNQ